MHGGKLVSRRFNPDSLELTGEAVPVASDVEFSPDLHVGSFSASNTGALVWTSKQQQHQLVWVDRSGKKLEVIDERGRFEQVSLARNAAKLTASVLDTATMTRSVWSFDLARHTVTREIHQSGWPHPVISPDGKRIVHSTNQGSGLQLFLREVSSTEEAKPLLPEPGTHRYATDWSRDGKSVLFTQRHPNTGEDIWVMSVERQPAARPLLATSYNESQAQFSPDGRWIAYTSNDSGGEQVYVMTIDGGQRHQVSVDGGMEPRWRADGRELFFIKPTGMMSSVEVRTRPAWEAGQPRELFRCGSERRLEWTSSIDYDVSSDGSRFVMTEVQVRNLGFTVRLTGR